MEPIVDAGSVPLGKSSVAHAAGKRRVQFVGVEVCDQTNRWSEAGTPSARLINLALMDGRAASGQSYWAMVDAQKAGQFSSEEQMTHHNFASFAVSLKRSCQRRLQRFGVNLFA